MNYLCDIGNTNISIKNENEIFSLSVEQFLSFRPSQKVYYINVNQKLKEELKKRKNFIDLATFFDFQTNYKGLGIDRICACYAAQDGVIVDAGSAISVDFMNKGIHEGGYLFPGIKALKCAFASISKVLDVKLKENINLNEIPQNTQDAVSFGLLSPLILSIEKMANDKKIIFTGGDGKFLSSFFNNSLYEKDLIFYGMMKVMKKKDIKC